MTTNYSQELEVEILELQSEIKILRDHLGICFYSLGRAPAWIGVESEIRRAKFEIRREHDEAIDETLRSMNKEAIASEKAYDDAREREILGET